MAQKFPNWVPIQGGTSHGGCDDGCDGVGSGSGKVTSAHEGGDICGGVNDGDSDVSSVGVVILEV